jgi:hypothetical protein
MWIHLILIFKKSKLWNNHEQIKVQMNFLNIYIHGGRLFVCFVSMVHKTYQYRLLIVRWCTFFVVSFGTSIKTITIINDDDPPPFYPSCSYGIKHHINKLWALHCRCRESCIESKVFLMCYFNLVFISKFFCHLFNEHHSSYSIFLQSSCKPLDKLLVQ